MLTLDKIAIGRQVRMVGFDAQMPALRQQLLARGMTPGVIITMLGVAPLGDPIQVMLRGYTLSLRRKECQQIKVEYVYDSNVISQNQTHHRPCRQS